MMIVGAVGAGDRAADVWIITTIYIHVFMCVYIYIYIYITTTNNDRACGGQPEQLWLFDPWLGQVV